MICRKFWKDYSCDKSEQEFVRRGVLDMRNTAYEIDVTETKLQELRVKLAEEERAVRAARRYLLS